MINSKQSYIGLTSLFSAERYLVFTAPANCNGTGSSIKTLSNSSPAYAVLSINTVSIANSSLRNNDEFTHHFQVDAAPTAIVTSLSKNDQFTQSLVGAAPMTPSFNLGVA